MLGGIGIGDAEILENVALERFHLLGFIVLHMVVTEQVEHAMDDEMGKMIGKTLVLFRRLARDGFAGGGCGARSW